MSSAGARILVVDDNEDNRYTLTRRLRREGYTDVAEATNGREALERLMAEPFDLVLLDLMMPEMSGDQVLERLRDDPERRDIPVIMISASTEIDGVVRCIERGAADYLPKPFNPVILRARIGACLEKKRLHDQAEAHRAEIERQRRRADELLHAILPGHAVTELTTTETVTPRRYENVVVLFADVVGFTRFCDAHEPELVVRNLDLLARAFEELTAAHGLEKIKTMGDAILATGGLLLENDDPVMAAVDCARATLAAGRELPTPWGLRVGIHLGPVVAGIVGRQKLTFDLWGDTVNVAARLGSLGREPGIHLSVDAWRRVAGRLAVTPLGSVPLKGKGEMEVYRVATDA